LLLLLLSLRLLHGQLLLRRLLVRLLLLLRMLPMLRLLPVHSATEQRVPAVRNNCSARRVKHCPVLHGLA
jgi:hypothetical protein